MKQNKIYFVCLIDNLEAKMKKIIILFSIILIIQSCVSTNKTSKDYFGYNNNPKYETSIFEKFQDKPEISSTSSYDYEPYERKIEVYNYYIGPYDPLYYERIDPFDWGFYYYLGRPYYDPFWGCYVYYKPHHHHPVVVYYPHPYDYWYPRKRVIYVPVQREEPKKRTTRTFGPSRGTVDFESQKTSSPSKEKRSERRDGHSNESKPKEIAPDKNDAPKIKIQGKTPATTPNTPDKPSESPKESPSKQERSSTRPK